ncbi:hypothetical protein DTO013E5_6875 [Penicillium roqueforti]|uniref:uncharacterized protein n=1 Tax=Penicillium roqueforti TaxID=5082 RepID=UPI00190BD590|nr:uncharacterized protein LCP9604111_8171 [Penicillium roqueforti]KAF9241898.1 hypothetical protein LCP9604111_8171 [Penicillium roqueforti]KAI1832730.1 hypothetical protein CBS147337_6580 [Penicillium roqueforti]KAI2679768.1 hypothetical protein CBS147355_4250 [Penicillium roqueforti]KAI2684317.1 hypothetical protein LCP963914a_5617 [Penicillium roqueforti]KAI2697492.1 hypothetical protein CBS147372_7852 [Penicillium roqueforti]
MIEELLCVDLNISTEDSGILSALHLGLQPDATDTSYAHIIQHWPYQSDPVPNSVELNKHVYNERRGKRLRRCCVDNARLKETDMSFDKIIMGYFTSSHDDNSHEFIIKPEFDDRKRSSLLCNITLKELNYYHPMFI